MRLSRFSFHSSFESLCAFTLSPFEISSDFHLVLRHALHSSMAITSKGRTEVPVPKKWKERETSPGRTKVWIEPKHKAQRKVPVVYYLCRNGHLEHPHFMEVPLSSSEGLYLRDVINRLNFLRGKGMARLYSWSSKRSYKNGFVWHDLSENDFIYPAHGKEYVLKGSELAEASLSSGSEETLRSSSERLLEMPKSGGDSEFPVRRRNLSWSALDINEYKVYKADSTVEIAGKAADVSTQTDDKRRGRRAIKVEDQEQDGERKEDSFENPRTELSGEEISPPPLSSSPDTLETLMKADGRVINGSIRGEEGEICEVGDRNNQSGRIRASAVLMQLISCGSVAVREEGFSSISHHRGRLPRGEQNQQMEKCSSGVASVEDKEYFSGSLIETKAGNSIVGEFQGLKRSASYNADRSSKSDLLTKDTESGRGAKCIPRKPKTLVKKE